MNEEKRGRSARSYVFHFFNTVQNLKHPTSDIVIGLGAFDLETLLTGPIEQAMSRQNFH